MTHFGEIGAAVIGSGFIGTVHVEALRRIGVQRRRAARGDAGAGHRRAAGLLGVAARVREPLDELLADDGVQVVHVTSPNDLHVPQVRQILAAGRHVVCEKPLAMTAGNRPGWSDRPRPPARERGQLQHPLLPAQPARARDRCDRGGVGDVRLRHGPLLPGLAPLDTDWNWRLETRRRAARCVPSATSDRTGSTSLTFVSGLPGRIASWPTSPRSSRSATSPPGPSIRSPRSAAPRPCHVEIHTEDVATILLRFEGGARGAWRISQVSPGRKNSLAVRDRRVGLGGGVGLRAARPPVARATATGRTRS